MTNPQVIKLRTNELDILDKSEKETLIYKGYKIQTYQWGKGKKKVLLIHGWEGQAGNFSDLIEKLLAADYSVHAFDAPSHGFSSKGATSLFEFSEVVGLLIREFEVDKLVSHSFGGVAATYALYNNLNLAIKKYALLTTPDKFTERIDSVVEMVGITEKVKDKLIAKVQLQVPMNISDFSVSNFVKNINVGKAMVIHDKNDRVLSIAQSENVVKNWQNATLKTVEGTGHFRILRTESVLNEVVEFLEK